MIRCGGKPFHIIEKDALKKVITEIVKCCLCESCEKSCGIGVSCKKVENKVKDIKVDEVVRAIRKT